MAGTPKANVVMFSNLIPLTLLPDSSGREKHATKDALEPHHNPEQPIASLDTRLNECHYGW